MGSFSCQVKLILSLLCTATSTTFSASRPKAIMAHRSSRYQPEHDDPYISRDAYPEPYNNGRVNDTGYEYVGTEEVPDTVEPSSSRQRSPARRHHKPRRASTLPPEASDSLDPPRSRRNRSPSGRSKPSESPPRRRQSRRDVSPSTRIARPEAAAAAAVAGVGAGGKFKNKYGQWVNGPAAKNMKVYGKKGLNTVGNLVEAYAAAQAGGAAAGMGRPGERARSSRYDDYDEPHDPYDRPSRRSRPRYTPSPSPSPPRRSAYKRSERTRPTMNGRHKSYSMSPAPRGRGKGYDSDEDLRHDRRSRRHSPSTSPSPSPRRRRGRARSYSRGRESVAPSTRSKSHHHPHMQHYKDEMKSPNSDVAHRWQFAARAALEAGGMTAFRLRKEPGSWTGQKGAKVVTAAIGAAAIDSFIDKDPRRKKQGGVKGMAESVVGGMLASKLMGMPASTTHKGKARW